MHNTLVVDNWKHIFSFLPTRSKPKIAEVSKSFKEIVSRSWTSFELNLFTKDQHYGKKYDIKGQTRLVVKLRQYLTKYCNTLVDLNLQLLDLIEENWLDSVFAIRTLKRLSISLNYIHIPKDKFVSQVPNCRDLQLLRLNGPDNLSVKTLTLILSGLPNLIELYLPERATFTSARPFSHTKKLERLMATLSIELTADDIIEQCPSLKFILAARHSSRVLSQRIASTNIVHVPRNIDFLDLERCKMICPLLTKQDLCCLSRLLELDFERSKPIFEFLVKEGHIDLNCTTPADQTGIYRPNIFENYTYHNIPLHSAVQHSRLEQIRFLVNLGASAECPDPNDSYLRIARTEDARILVLELGADPNKMIEEPGSRFECKYPAFMAFLCERRDITTTGVGRYLNALKDRGVNMNVTTSNGESFLELAIRNAYRIMFWTLMSFETIEWTPRALDALFKANVDSFWRVLETYQIDQKLILPQLAVKAITTQKNLINNISVFRQRYADALNNEGYNTLHYLVLLTKYRNYITKQLKSENFQRWTILLDESAPRTLGEDKDQNDDVTMKEEEEENTIDKELNARISDFSCNINATTREGETALLLVCKSLLPSDTKLKRINVLLHRHADVNIADKHGWTPLHAACYALDLPLAKKLLTHGANLNARDNRGITPFLASIYGFLHVEWTRPSNLIFIRNFITLVGNQIDFKACDNIWKRNCVHLLAGFEDPNLLAKIIDHIDVNARDAEGFTPLHYAVLRGCNATIEYLLDHGANPNLQTYALKLTPAMLYFHITTRISRMVYHKPKVDSSESKFMANLLTFGTLFFSTPTAKDFTADLPLAPLIEPPWINFETRSQETLKEVDFDSVLRNPLETITKLLALSDLNLLDSFGNTYLHLIAQEHIGPYDYVVDPLLAQFPQLNTQWTIKNDDNDTPFGLICCNTFPMPSHTRRFELILKLIEEYGLDINEPGVRGSPPLYYIMKDENIPTFLKFGMPSAWLHVPLQTPTQGVLEYLVENNKLSTDVLLAMVKKDPALLTQQNWLGQTFLMIILQRILEDNTDDFEFLRILLWYKAHLNVQDDNGNTALHIACKYFHLGLVESILGKINNTRYSERFFVTVFKLLEAGCDPSIKNKRGETPQDYVPHLHEYYQSLYLDWIKGLQYKDEVTPDHPLRRENDDDVNPYYE